MTQLANPSAVISVDRRAQALALRREGHTYERIGKMMGVTKQTAHELVMKGLEERRTQLAEDADGVRDIELERLDRLTLRMLKRLDSPRNEMPERTVAAIVRIMERRAALLGLDAPKDLRLGGIPGGIPIPTSGVLDVSKMSLEDLEKLERMWLLYGRTDQSAPTKVTAVITEVSGAAPARSGENSGEDSES